MIRFKGRCPEKTPFCWRTESDVQKRDPYFCEVEKNGPLNMWLGWCIHMSHDQGEWVTCRQFSILFFQYKSLVHLQCYILIQTPSQLNIWLQSYEQFFKVKNNVKHKNLSPLLACNSKSIFPTSDSFSLIMSHMYIARIQQYLNSGLNWQKLAIFIAF